MLDREVEDSERSLTLREAIDAIKRRRKPMLIAAASMIVITLLIAGLWPSSYQSTGTILIEQQELPVDLVRSTVTSYADQRVQVISQRVMTTQTLLGIIRRYDLYPRERARESREELIQRMRDDVEFKMISADVIDPRSGVPRSATIAFTVAYTSKDPAVAAKIANELTTLYLNENLTERTRLAEDASGFLGAEGDRLSKHIAELEAKLAAFKEKNMGQLPELSVLNMQLLEGTDRELRDARTRLQSLQQQQTYLQAQLAQLKPNGSITTESGERVMSSADRLKVLRTQLASARAVYSPEHPDIVRLQTEIAGLEAETGSRGAPANELRRKIEAARGRLAQMREKYAADFPDIQTTQREIAELEKELNAAPAADSGVALGAPEEAPDNPSYIQIRAQLEASRNDQSALTTEIGRLYARQAEFQRKISASPVIEQEYRELARDYDNAQLKYREIRAKQMEAQVAQNLEANRKGERFTLIEPPLAPEEPVSPNRPLILILGALLSLIAAAGAAALMEQLDTSVRGRNDLVDAFAAAPLAIIPRISTDLESAAERHRLRLTAGTAVAVGVVAVAALHFLYRPLDVLWFIALRRLGF
jgi:uncharacterized protein involved in exopolysaccharide biosynthesis